MGNLPPSQAPTHAQRRVFTLVWPGQGQGRGRGPGQSVRLQQVEVLRWAHVPPRSCGASGHVPGSYLSQRCRDLRSPEFPVQPQTPTDCLSSPASLDS